jgi:hypothetical protein
MTTITIEPHDVSSPVIDGPEQIIKLGYAYRAAKVLLSAVELGVFTVLAKRACDLDTLREEIGIAKRGARDFFDALVALKLISRDSAGLYRNTPLSDRYLDASKPTYIGDELDYLNARGYPRWHRLTAALRTGMPQSDIAEGGYFRTLCRDQVELETFVRGMTGGTRLAARFMAEHFPWREYNTVIDIGTAQGCFPVQIAGAHGHITGGGFDLPAAQIHFDSYVQEHALGHRLRFYPGDFLQDPLPCADVLVLGRVLHNWELTTKKMLLKKTYEALPRGGVLIVYERMIDDERRLDATALLGSVHMLLVTPGGFDFTGTDCIGWIEEAGFHGACVKVLPGGMSVITALK